MLRIGEVARRYGISNRTLRYWEEVGMLKSVRAENDYRYYDAENVARIHQIVLLRKLKMPIAEIERIFIADSYSVAVEVLSDYLVNLKHKTNLYYSLAVMVENLLGNIKKSQSIEEMFSFLAMEKEILKDEQEVVSKSGLSERRLVVMEHLKKETLLQNVRIIELPPMTVASCRVESETPEVDCAKIFDQFVLEHNLHKRSGHRSFGFNNPEPTEGSPIYGYELWVTIPEDFALEPPFEKRQFPGGKYASISAQLNETGERWEALYHWSTENETYVGDFSRQWLEEQVMDYETFMSNEVPDSEKQLDLLLPIQRKE